MNKIPKYLRAILWSADITKLNPRKDAPYIVHQILSYGRLNHIIWLFKNYPKSEIIRIFKETPYKDYTPSRFNLITKHLLHLPGSTIDERKYVKNIPRNIG
ncbi:hypothetical protein A3D05_02660 [Candidatus Gottesmanbacteria bacterium RIFCSPHIGHO2_02_FULL_40_24]|uniref:DUF6922 domain-containing protein n=1 Tax=Candidatus Gottesmanbacteria bacterium RIFCSPHIGHO2_01_FULL_40_15 TaxID=1798376 RepID=A0A1F5Z267_9BACT|nr:MAG: hypothetical protein A2777_05225 [Candidatus Gottesmanbacteria bacterium RIFCSPHIGHO2_01_FULL_40_15]OGG16719.1 MAG: hypothetical protein A3D05_02660 [Candidatus Gottesmanbacteria bacterium RIFCSPHIGHO2_02_FULL_40_24]OGG23047.1 MAG: hypothetical protein A3B48_01355 [Candidatus Gottesmanbacteria bacterium RIFCSPLOWO2_01_FULL_40_10]OGG23150.1 MAG: hypothetical protein A3E42_03340 [Candidatus Gottesmanbacteria bacterium RIFCSPHIGHO2_12_FULL_40_13]OGG33959.1 MAG: hypothetical protein A3I80_0